MRGLGRKIIERNRREKEKGIRRRSEKKFYYKLSRQDYSRLVERINVTGQIT